ncbi:hypothetical protein CAEBREN_00129 [Caenorhabditis brenneri]|uniref:F-box domain-containing protein n=1 Tax=Caenorhabditis brenneri TaxID=135651 RepID=G0N1G9_CAEBE|nr:hypothetical protein CAEBREN_00129 [Caenorhabditis brenneri]
MEPNGLNLLQMPEDIMGLILNKLDMSDILILRKTCHHLRNLVDDLHPEPKIVSTCIIVDRDWIRFEINRGQDGRPRRNMIRIKYFVTKKPENGREVCKMLWFRGDRRGVAFVDDADYITPFCRDFETFFGGRIFEFSKKPKNPTRFQDFSLNFEFAPPDIQTLLSFLESTLKNRLRPLRVKEFLAVGCEKSHVLQILPLFEPKTLEKISIWRMVSPNLDGLSELEQWKMAKNLLLTDVRLGARLPEFKDFEWIHIKLEDVKVEEVLEVKEAILNSTCNTTGRVWFDKCDAEQYFQETYGLPFIDMDEGPRSWFFKCANKKSTLQISFYYRWLQFDLLEEAPRGALVY